MPRRRYEDEEETDERTRWSDDDDQGDHGAGEEAGLKPVIIGGVRIPTLMEIRQHINANAWNGQAFTSHMTHRDVFAGECEYASTALSEMLTGTGKNLKSVSWKYRVRGLYSGDLSAIKSSHGCDARAFTENRHCHSWVEFGGKIIDVTWWQFDGSPARVYVFELDDPRYAKDETV